MNVEKNTNLILLKMALEKHHRKCKSNGGTYAKRNISKVKPTEHQAFHILFKNLDTYGIVKLLNEVWIDPDFKLIIFKK
jgi:hypothetical protein